MNPIALVLSVLLIGLTGTASAQTDPTLPQTKKNWVDAAKSKLEEKSAAWDSARAIWGAKPVAQKWAAEWMPSPDGALQARSVWNEAARAWEIRVWDHQAREWAGAFTSRWDLKKWIEQRGSVDTTWKAWIESASAGEESEWSPAERAEWAKTAAWE